MLVFLVLMLMPMRLCLCFICASENSIRQISGFVLLMFLLMFLLMLTLMSRVFLHLMLTLCYAYALVRTSVKPKLMFGHLYFQFVQSTSQLYKHWTITSETICQQHFMKQLQNTRPLVFNLCCNSLKGESEK